VLPERIGIGRLGSVAILYDGDFHDLAVWLLRADEARSTPTTAPRHTLRGVAVCYEFLTGIALSEVLAHLEALQLPLAATLEQDHGTATPIRTECSEAG
jgi:hypothetical protein